MKRFLLILATSLGLAATAVPASADIVYTLNNGGGLLPTPGNYGTITATQFASDTVRVTINLLPDERFVTTGSHSGITWSLQGSPTLQSISIVSSNASKFTVQSFNPAGSYQNSPFGPFEYAIAWNGNGASNPTETSIVFDIKSTSALTLSPSLFSPVGGVYFAIDIGTGCTTETKKGETKTSCAKTGVIGSTTYTQVPEPGTWTMSIAGLMGVAGLVMLQRRRKLARI